MSAPTTAAELGGATSAAHSADHSADSVPDIAFVRPLPGLGDARRFALVPVDDAGVLFTMNSLDAPGVRLVVAAPGLFFPDYAPEVADDEAAALGITDPAEAVVLVVLTVADSLESSTANLLAPIVVHRDTREAAQIVLAGSDLPLRAPLVA